MFAPPPRSEDLGLGEDLQRLLERDREQLLLARDVAEVLVLLNVRPVTAVVGDDRHAIGRIGAERARQLQQVGCVDADRSSVIVLNRLAIFGFSSPGGRLSGVPHCTYGP